MATSGDVHIRGGDGRNLCDQPGESITVDEALNPDDGKTFGCGACLAKLADVDEPSMGGSHP